MFKILLKELKLGNLVVYLVCSGVFSFNCIAKNRHVIC